MKPIPETAQAIREFPDLVLGQGLLAEFPEIDAVVRRIVPDCVGLSLASVELGAIFTLVASSDEIAIFDALQYLDGGPCVEALTADRVVSCTIDDLLDEEEWRLFAQATAVMAIQSTLSLPIIAQGRVTASVNLYGASAHAFTGHHEELAAALGAWAPGAVENADLSFRSRLKAREAPRHLREAARVDIATHLLAASQTIQLGHAEQRLREAAIRAGVSQLELAEALIELFRQPET